MPMHIRLLNDNIAVRQDPVKEISDGGIILPEAAQQRSTVGTVVAVGRGRYESGQLIPMQIGVGDRVMYSQYSGSKVTVDGEELIIFAESACFCVFPCKE